MIRTVILDLDGPVLDIKRRHYACYSEILRQRKYIPLEINDYWRMKRQAVGWPQILAATHASSIGALFKKDWNQLIEGKEFLTLDRVQPGCIQKLEEWSRQQIQLILATMRSSTERLKDQLSKLGLRGYFSQVIVIGNGPRRPRFTKAKIVEPFIANHKESVLWIGDTEEDIEAARKLRCRVYAVTCGIRNKSFLKQHQPDGIAQNLKSVNLI